MGNAKTTIATFVGALCISLAPVPAKSVNSLVIPSMQQRDLVSHKAPSGFVFLPISEASSILREDAANLRAALKRMIALREKNGGGLLYPAQFRSKMIKAVKNQTQFIFELKEAIKIAITEVTSSEKQLNGSGISSSRKQLIEFGKAVASVEFALQNVLSAYEQSKAPGKTLTTTGLISADDARKLIEAEHKKIGLSQSVFDH
ncbi:conserved exported hypothetical protein [Xenorhabdus nematophila F1]|uniref:hypothetical protein n=1 Tax=Xenorhabdus nematophila TaxID=628 RepID=UPI0003275AE1|nr:hypothetical protein [Xenorhabdus nematophila]CCW31051.1 conserved exported hypothetical protein [Xenorhabdus nematophila F1]